MLLNVVFTVLPPLQSLFLYEIFRMKKSLNHLSEVWQSSPAVVVSDLQKEIERDYDHLDLTGMRFTLTPCLNI